LQNRLPVFLKFFVFIADWQRELKPRPAFPSVGNPYFTVVRFDDAFGD
jgi:hypothetical protein